MCHEQLPLRILKDRSTACIIATGRCGGNSEFSFENHQIPCFRAILWGK